MTHDDITAALRAVADEIKSRLDGEFPDVPEFRVRVEAEYWCENGNVTYRGAIYHPFLAEVDGYPHCGVDAPIDRLADRTVAAAIDKMRAAIAKAREQTNGLYEYANRQEVSQ